VKSESRLQIIDYGCWTIGSCMIRRWKKIKNNKMGEGWHTLIRESLLIA
jgi:hypothetical protein